MLGIHGDMIDSLIHIVRAEHFLRQDINPLPPRRQKNSAGCSSVLTVGLPATQTSFETGFCLPLAVARDLAQHPGSAGASEGGNLGFPHPSAPFFPNLEKPTSETGSDVYMTL